MSLKNKCCLIVGNGLDNNNNSLCSCSIQSFSTGSITQGQPSAFSVKALAIGNNL